MNPAATDGACLACGAEGLCAALDLGDMPPANLLVKTRHADYRKRPLQLMYCAICGHGQLSHFMPPEELFSHYLYASGTSGTLRGYFSWFRDQIAAVYPNEKRVLEIACNDGSLLALFAQADYATLGVDPARNLTEQARRQGLHVIDAFWPCPDKLKSQFDLVVAMNVLAHTPTPLAFMQGIRDALTKDGVALIQTSQALMLDNGEFDTIYHEHYSFFTEHSFAVLTRRAGLEPRRTVLTDIHGVSSVSIVTHPGTPPPPVDLLAHGAFAVPRDSPVMQRFREIKGTPRQYRRFGDLALGRMKEVGRHVTRARQKGRAIGFVGAAAKSLTFLHAAQLRPDHLYDEAPLKIGMFAPGLDLAVEPLDAISGIDEPMLIVLSAWNFAPELAQKTRLRRPSRGDQFLVYFPTLALFD